MTGVLFQIVAAAAEVTPTPNPTPGLREGLDESVISPGLAGFLAVFAVALGAVLLFYSLTGKLRRVRVRGALADERSAREVDPAAPADADQGGDEADPPAAAGSPA